MSLGDLHPKLFLPSNGFKPPIEMTIFSEMRQYIIVLWSVILSIISNASYSWRWKVIGHCIRDRGSLSYLHWVPLSGKSISVKITDVLKTSGNHQVFSLTYITDATIAEELMTRPSTLPARSFFDSI